MLNYTATSVILSLSQIRECFQYFSRPWAESFPSLLSPLQNESDFNFWTNAAQILEKKLSKQNERNRWNFFSSSDKLEKKWTRNDLTKFEGKMRTFEPNAGLLHRCLTHLHYLPLLQDNKHVTSTPPLPSTTTNFSSKKSQWRSEKKIWQNV